MEKGLRKSLSILQNDADKLFTTDSDRLIQGFGRFQNPYRLMNAELVTFFRSVQSASSALSQDELIGRDVPNNTPTLQRRFPFALEEAAY